MSGRREKLVCHGHEVLDLKYTVWSGVVPGRDLMMENATQKAKGIMKIEISTLTKMSQKKKKEKHHVNDNKKQKAICKYRTAKHYLGQITLRT